jgi:hypothetical protein
MPPPTTPRHSRKYPKRHHTKTKTKTQKRRQRNRRPHESESKSKSNPNPNPKPKSKSKPPTIYIYFVHVPKTAGSAIKQTLAQNDDGGNGNRNGNRGRDEGWTLHTTEGQRVRIIAKGHSRADQFPPRARNVFKIATVREPVERFISAFNFVREGGINHPNQGAVQQARNWAPRLQRHKTIGAFLRDTAAVAAIMAPGSGHTHFDHLMPWVTDAAGRLDVDFVIRQTHVDADFGSLCELFRLRLKAGTVRPFNVTGRKPPITAETRAVLADLLEDDIALYGRIVSSIDRMRDATRTKLKAVLLHKGDCD